VQAGEVFGLAGLVGAGRTETLRAIFGATPRDAGEIRVHGRVVRIGDPADAVAAGIGLVPEDRKTQGLLLPRTVGHNASLGALERFARHGWIDVAREDEAVAARFAGLALKHASLRQPVVELSGGNQQKAVIARWLLREVDVLLLDEPTRGIDVAAKAVIYGLLAELAAAGKAIVLVSSETPELMAVCDRIAVMSAGRIAAEFTPADWSEEKINRAAFHGHAHN
jgi:ribose transport system ATP-binding protein